MNYDFPFEFWISIEERVSIIVAGAVCIVNQEPSLADEVIVIFVE
jgi:hypothetical protein